MVLESETVQVEYSMMTCTSKTLKLKLNTRYLSFYKPIYLSSLTKSFFLGHTWSLHILLEDDEIDIII